MNAYLLEEHCCQILSKSYLKQQSLNLFLNVWHNILNLTPSIIAYLLGDHAKFYPDLTRNDGRLRHFKDGRSTTRTRWV